jgi:hypothetical protein
VGAVLLALGLAARGLTEGVNFAGFAALVAAAALLGLACVCAFWALALQRLRYEVGDEALTIVWGLTRQVVPLTHIERVVRGRALGLPRVQGIALPGWDCHVGRAEVPRLGPVLFYSTHRAPTDILYLVTPGEVYGISPVNGPELIGALQAAAADASEEVRQEVLRHPVASLPAWTDRFGLILAGIGTVIALAAVGVIFARYTAIPADTILAFPDGDHPSSKTALLGIPAAALALLALNLTGALTLHRPLRPVAYMLLLGDIAVQSVLLVAAVAAT